MKPSSGKACLKIQRHICAGGQAERRLPTCNYEIIPCLLRAVGGHNPLRNPRTHGLGDSGDTIRYRSNQGQGPHKKKGAQTPFVSSPSAAAIPPIVGHGSLFRVRPYARCTVVLGEWGGIRVARNPPSSQRPPRLVNSCPNAGELADKDIVTLSTLT